MSLQAYLDNITAKTGIAPDEFVALARARGLAQSGWRPVYDKLVENVSGFGPDIDVAPAASYLNLRRARRKFAIVQVTAQRLDIGLKLKGMEPAGRLESAGGWNAMVTHRVRIHKPADVDRELLGWLKQAYVSAG